DRPGEPSRLSGPPPDWSLQSIAHVLPAPTPRRQRAPVAAVVVAVVPVGKHAAGEGEAVAEEMEPEREPIRKCKSRRAEVDRARYGEVAVAARTKYRRVARHANADRAPHAATHRVTHTAAHAAVTAHAAARGRLHRRPRNDDCD